MSRFSSWRHALSLTTPVMLGYVPLGIAFGVLCVQMGHAWWLAPLMSVAIYSGASQFLLLSLLAAGASLTEIGVAIFLLSARHLFYGLSLVGRFRGSGARKPYLVYALTDETYSLLSSREETRDPAVAFRISLLNQGWWLLGSLLGALAGSLLSFDSTGMEFALTALFIVLTLELMATVKRMAPFAIGLACGLGALLLLPQRHMLLAAIGAACLVLLLDYRRRAPRPVEQRP
ncbi:AzlC family ABC transporter permease [Alloalcanivorax profundimaris]|uniref:AzlC family ABC transporter permease n=1 Tax=Alloalcanivorax profundimaris TaxID=2735259 RepID=UPI001888E857|nr:AzlC family ABC transporter permease [Alloalcanivorax profundimaris]MBF1800476.1 AzlC family ABC transporter permease [Alloalcanivorax profundimaris]MCQ6263490.1 AzlC family ABC transporter permease [Alcanivorax sp. MM125-6]